MGRVHVGTSGFAYRHWRGVLYPPELPARLWLRRYCSEFSTVELNNTFYRLPRPDAVDRWRRDAPAGFLFSAKGSRFLTHMKRLLDAERGLARFFEPVSRLGEKLAVVLWQLPPGWKADPERLDRFLSALPRGVRHAFEFRDESWYADEVCAALDRHGAAFCEHDLVARPPPRLTGGFRYVRFHGTTGAYAGRYGPRALRPWADDLSRSARRGDAFVYFNNDVDGHAVEDARALLALLGGAAHASNRIRSGSSTHSFTLTRNDTASRPSTRR
jgi:uncharacterized protein YecE (DUF72 family)